MSVLHRWLWPGALRRGAVLAAVIGVLTPLPAMADPGSLIALAATAATAAAQASIASTPLLLAVTTAISVGSAFARAALARNSNSSAQRAARTRTADPHAPFRFAFGEFAHEGDVVFKHTTGQALFMVLRLNAIASDAVLEITINDGTVLTWADISALTDFSVDHNPTNPIWSDQAGTKDAALIMHVGLGDQTAPPDRWLSEIGPGGEFSNGKIKASDNWLGQTVVFVRAIFGGDKKAAQRWTNGVEPPLRFRVRGSKQYDPRRDDTSGVPGASGAQRLDDPATWEYTANPAICALTIAHHRLGLGLPDRRINIQQFADAADAAEPSEATASVAIDPAVHGGSTVAQGIANGVTVSGFDPEAVVTFQLTPDQEFGGIAVTGNPTPLNPPGQTGTGNGVWVVAGGDEASVRIFGSPGYVYDGYAAAAEAFPGGAVSGATNYTFFVVDTPLSDNTGGMEFDLVARSGFRCDGLITMTERQYSILDPILACMGGSVDTSRGLLGIQAGVWTAPVATLEVPVGDSFEVVASEDAGFDQVRPTLFPRTRDYEETDGQVYEKRSGPRVLQLALPLVSEFSQAYRLAQLAAKTAEPPRRITGTWGGAHKTLSVGDRVTMPGLPGFNYVAGTYLVESKGYSVELVGEGGGVRIACPLTLVEDRPDYYVTDWAGYSEPQGLAPGIPNQPGINPPTGCELAAIEEAGQFTEGATTLAIRHRFLPVEGADTYDVEVYTEPYGAGEDTLGGTSQRIQVDASQTVDDGGTLKVEHIVSRASAGATYRFRTYALAAGLGRSDTYLECSITAAAPSDVLGLPEIVSQSHDGANTATHRLRAPNSPGVTFLRLSAGDQADRSDLAIIETVNIGALGEHDFLDANAFSTRRYLRAVAIDQYGREGQALDFDFLAGSSAENFRAREGGGVRLREGGGFRELE
ncbi:MAG: hypothetical protein AAF183_13045 [Pseudomonadota bacterium]